MKVKITRNDPDGSDLKKGDICTVVTYSEIMGGYILKRDNDPDPLPFCIKDKDFDIMLEG